MSAKKKVVKSKLKVSKRTIKKLGKVVKALAKSKKKPTKKVVRHRQPIQADPEMAALAQDVGVVKVPVSVTHPGLPAFAKYGAVVEPLDEVDPINQEADELAELGGDPNEDPDYPADEEFDPGANDPDDEEVA